jgi:ribose transport system substrate-binding protein
MEPNPEAQDNSTSIGRREYTRTEFLGVAGLAAVGALFGPRALARTGLFAEDGAHNLNTDPQRQSFGKTTYRIALTEPVSLTFFDEFFHDIRLAASKDDSFTIINGNGDQGVLITDVQSAIALGFNGILINGITASGWGVLQSALDKHIVVTNHSAFPLTYVSQNIIVAHYAAGYMVGQLAAKWVSSKKGTIEVATVGARSDPYIATRGIAFVDALTKYAPNAKVVTRLSSDNITAETAASLVADALEAFPGISAMFALTDPACQGAIVALKEAGRTNKKEFLLCEVDGASNILEAMLQDTALQISASMYYAYSAVQEQWDMEKLLHGEKVPPTRYLLPRMVTPSTVNQALNELNNPLSPANAHLYKSLMIYSNTPLVTGAPPSHSFRP